MRNDSPIELNISSLSASGEGIASGGHGAHSAILVPRAIPGDTVAAMPARVGGRGGRAGLVKIIKPSPSRVDPGCAAFDKGCGGCQWLCMEYGEQLKWKARFLRGALEKAGIRKVTVRDAIGMKDPSGCRNKLSLLNRGGGLVFMQERSSMPIAIGDCPQEMGPVRKAYARLRQVRLPSEVLQVHIRGTTDGSIGVCFFAKKTAPAVKKAAEKIMKEIPGAAGVGAAGYRGYRTVAGRGFVEQKVGGISYRIPLNGFFQTNYAQAEVIQGLVMEHLPEKPGGVLDLYCGAGFFSIPAALKADRVLGIENNPDAVRAAAGNAALNKTGNAEFAAADAARAMRELRPGMFSAVILDPPREGCGPGVIKELVRLRPERILYISCLPESLGRDMKALLDGNYRAAFCRPVDMFPHTSHIESVTVLERS